ncbi:uncharacterized protein [Elaeis guineensis]|uniref:uncharacterized protein n=1 Tax=Elaeis guineensis var. tenera TaxID=51953 RepID=UPI003C6D2241
MTTLKDGFLKNRLQYSLEKTYPHDFAEMLARAKKYARADEAFEGESLMGASVAISTGLAHEQDKIQRPIYYVSRVQYDAETRYTKLRKLIFTLIIMIRRLHPYFQAHLITVLTNQPIRAILHRLDTFGQLAKWVIELTEFEVRLQSRPSIKVQILADFIVECTILEDLEPPEPSQEEDTLVESKSSEEPSDMWIIHVDGSSNSTGSEAGLLLLGPKGFTVEYALRFDFLSTNNEAKYEALYVGLRVANELRV